MYMYIDFCRFGSPIRYCQEQPYKFYQKTGTQILIYHIYHIYAYYLLSTYLHINYILPTFYLSTTYILPSYYAVLTYYLHTTYILHAYYLHSANKLHYLQTTLPTNYLSTCTTYMLPLNYLYTTYILTQVGHLMVVGV